MSSLFENPKWWNVKPFPFKNSPRNLSMSKKKSKYKKIFEDNSLSDLQKYRMITNLQNKNSIFWSVVIGLNAILWPLLFVIPNIEIDNSKISPIVALKDWKNKVLPLILINPAYLGSLLFNCLPLMDFYPQLLFISKYLPLL